MTKNEAIIMNLLLDNQKMQRVLNVLTKNLTTTCTALMDENDILKEEIAELEQELVAEGATITEAEVMECLNGVHVWQKNFFIGKPCVCGLKGYKYESLSGGMDVRPKPAPPSTHKLSNADNET